MESKEIAGINFKDILAKISMHEWVRKAIRNEFTN